MFALRARPSATRASHLALRAQSMPSSVACDSRAKRNESRLSFSSTRLALFVRSFAQERKLSPLLSMKRFLERPQSLRQHIYFQPVVGSLTRLEIVTPTFPAPSALFVRSWTKERKLTILPSASCALFRKNTREGGIFQPSMFYLYRNESVTDYDFRSLRRVTERATTRRRGGPR
jgi:hypothetical protein